MSVGKKSNMHGLALGLGLRGGVNMQVMLGLGLSTYGLRAKDHICLFQRQQL